MKFHIFSENISWPVLMQYSNEWVDDVITSQFSTHFIYKNRQKSAIYCSYKNVNLALYPPKINDEIMFILIYFDTRICFYLYLEKNENLQNFMYNIYDKLWGDDITNSLIWIFIRTGQEMFSEKMWTSFKLSQLPYFLSDFHDF